MAVETERYYRQWGPMVLRRCRKMLADEDLARDAMHDVFVQVLLREESLEDRAPSSLLFRIATNVCLNKIRSKSRRPEVADDDLVARIAHASSEAERAAARSVLAKLFGSEPESSGAMAVMHLVDGMTLEQVAHEFGMSVSGVRKRLRKLRSQLRELEGV